MGAGSAASGRDTIAGMGLMVLSTAAAACMSCCVSLIGPSFPSMECTWLRFITQGLITAATIPIARKKSNLCKSETWLGKKENRLKLLTRAAWGVGGLTCWFWALGSMPLSDATCIFFTSVPLTTLLAAVLLKEPYAWPDAAGALVCMMGVILIAQPVALFGAAEGADIAPVSWGALAVTLFGAVCAAMAYVSVRQLKGEDPLCLVMWSSLLGGAVTPIMAATVQSIIPAPDARTAWLLIAMGGFGWVGQITVNKGLQLAPASSAVLMKYLDIVFAIIFQTTVFGKPPGALKLIGAGLIISTVATALYNARKKAYTEKLKQQATAAASTSTTSLEGNVTSDSPLDPWDADFAPPTAAATATAHSPSSLPASSGSRARLSPSDEHESISLSSAARADEASIQLEMISLSAGSESTPRFVAGGITGSNSSGRQAAGGG